MCIILHSTFVQAATGYINDCNIVDFKLIIYKLLSIYDNFKFIVNN